VGPARRRAADAAGRPAEHRTRGRARARARTTQAPGRRSTRPRARLGRRAARHRTEAVGRLSRTARLVWLCALACLLAGCNGPRRVEGPVIDRNTGLGRLGTAITAFDRARAQVLNATANVVTAAVALDAADAACAAGTTTAASNARAKARAATPKVITSLAALPARLTAYQGALAALAAAEQAATSLSAEQRSALDAVVTGGRAEARASDAFRVAGKTAWPAYVKLDAAQSLWLDRRLGGWYRTVEEAADAYAVLVRDDRPALERARTLIERVDTARRPVSDRVRLALAAADDALEPLRSPG
jgi:hypothetical protein